MHCEQNVVTLFYQDIVKQFNHSATVTTVGGEPGPYDPVSLKKNIVQFNQSSGQPSRVYRFTS